MNGYKKILKSSKLRLKLLNLLQWIPNKTMIKIQYWIKLKRKLDLKNPKRFTEKIQYYKMHYKNPILHKCVDKYYVREYVKSKGLENILNECFGVYNSVEEIDFNKLPNSFAIKSTKGGGGVNIIICENKQDFNIDNAKKEINQWFELIPKISYGREWAYDSNSNQVIIERLLKGNENGLSGINDYKFFCYNGVVEYIVFDGDRYIEHKRNFYDRNWNYLNVESDCKSFGDVIPKPIGLEEMISVAEKLSKDFPFVRVDLYWIDNKVYFGELTFYPWSGYVKFYPDEFDYKLGEKIIIK